MNSPCEELPIYCPAIDPAVPVNTAVQRFVKRHEHTPGNRLQQATMEMVVRVARCNRRAEQAQSLPLLRDQIAELKVTIIVGKNVKAFKSFGKLAEVGRHVDALLRGEMAGLRHRKAGRCFTGGAPWPADARPIVAGDRDTGRTTVPRAQPQACRQLAHIFEPPSPREKENQE